MGYILAIIAFFLEITILLAIEKAESKTPGLYFYR